jgi:hypothetical protein
MRTILALQLHPALPVAFQEHQYMTCPLVGQLTA